MSLPDLLVFVLQQSVQDEINRESRSDVVTIVASYLTMFVYVSFMLGQYRWPISRWPVSTTRVRTEHCALGYCLWTITTKPCSHLTPAFFFDVFCQMQTSTMNTIICCLRTHS